jgi:preprotein translocase subunit YajC
MSANLEFWMTAGIFVLTVLAAGQRFLQWREQRKHRKEQSDEGD